MKSIATTSVLILGLFANAQTYGPNSPISGSSSAVIGVNAWNNPGNIIASENSNADVTVQGVSRYLQGRQFGFAIPATQTITGIQVEVEKNAIYNNVALLNAWSTASVNRPLSAGTNRCMIVIISLENATSRDINNVSYNGVTMTQLAEEELMTTFYAKTEVWYLMESQLAGIPVGNHNITYSFAASSPVEDFEILTSAVYQHVDQIAPFFDVESSVRSGGGATYQIGQAMNTLAGSMSITSIFCGNPPSPMQAQGNSAAFSINSGFTERIDYHNYNPGFSGSGGVSEISDKSSAAAGTEQPTFTFAGSPNRLVAFGLSLRRARTMDNSVRLKKAAGYVGNDYAQTAVEWSTTQAYTIYGGPGDLWGTTWTPAEINDVNFGVGLSVNLQNFTGLAAARVDHIRITVFTTVVLPIEVTDLLVKKEDDKVAIKWKTQSERESDYFIVERSKDMTGWESVGTIDGSGNSSSELSYQLIDENPWEGESYYRLLHVNTSGDLTQIGVEAVYIAKEEYWAYPNPAIDKVYLEGKNLQSSEITVYNGSGEKIAIEQILVGERLLFSFDEVDKGVYFLSIRNGDDVATKKVLIVGK